ncbi:hypothetical protein LCGC14_2277270 [marine sediment metagenome]|uniref:Uncharacterized protein n=1 Tax=marine sediment metagenome TaxID=412755 RepID=A0A0F9F7R9_9ZZZZ
MINMTVRYTVKGHFSLYHARGASLEDNARRDVADMLHYDNARIERFRLITDHPPTAEIDIVGEACTVDRWRSFGYKVVCGPVYHDSPDS